MSWDSEGMRRDDGIEIRKHQDGSWMVFRPPLEHEQQGTIISYCPCCLKAMPTDRSARLVADVVWPEKDEHNE
jgi:hypothetical protein